MLTILNSTARRRIRAAGRLLSRVAIPLLLLLLASCGPDADQTPSGSAEHLSADDNMHAMHNEAMDQAWLEQQAQLDVYLSPEPQHDIFDPRLDLWFAHSRDLTPEARLFALHEPQHDIFDPRYDRWYGHQIGQTNASRFYSLPEPMHRCFDWRHDFYTFLAANGTENFHAIHDHAPDAAYAKLLADRKKAKQAKARSVKPKTFPGKDAEEQFLSFADYWLDKVNRNFPNNATNKVIEEQDGAFVASFVRAEKETMQTEVKPSDSKVVSHVGILRYFERFYSCKGASAEAAMMAPCDLLKQRKMTEIFAYSKGRWKE